MTALVGFARNYPLHGAQKTGTTCMQNFPPFIYIFSHPLLSVCDWRKFVLFYQPFFFLEVLEATAVAGIGQVCTHQMSEGLDWRELFEGPHRLGFEFP